MLHHILALIIDLVVAGKMSMAAEEFVSSLKLLQQREQEREAGRGIMSLLIGIGQRLRLDERHSTAGNGRRISVLPIFPSTVATCIMSASTTASSIVACPIILLENCVNAR